MCPIQQKMTRMAMVGVLCLFGLSVAIGDSPQRVIPALRVEDPGRVAEVIRLRALADARRGLPERGMDDPSTCAAKNCSMALHGAPQTGAEVLRLRDMATNHTRRGVKRPCMRENSFVDSPKRFVVARSAHTFNDTLTKDTCKKTSQSRIL